MKHLKKILFSLLLVFSLTFSSLNISPVNESIIIVEAATKKPAAITKITKVNATTASLKIKFKKIKAVKGYQIRAYEGKSLKKTITTKKTSATIRNLKPDTTYKIKVRAYTKSGKKTIYGKEKSISYKTKKIVPVPMPKPVPMPEVYDITDVIGEYVYVPATGKKYHNILDCGNMNPTTAKKITHTEATNSGYTPCSKCF